MDLNIFLRNEIQTHNDLVCMEVENEIAENLETAPAEEDSATITLEARNLDEARREFGPFKTATVSEAHELLEEIEQYVESIREYGDRVRQAFDLDLSDAEILETYAAGDSLALSALGRIENVQVTLEDMSLLRTALENPEDFGRLSENEAQKLINVSQLVYALTDHDPESGEVSWSSRGEELAGLSGMQGAIEMSDLIKAGQNWREQSDKDRSTVLQVLAPLFSPELLFNTEDRESFSSFLGSIQDKKDKVPGIAVIDERYNPTVADNEFLQFSDPEDQRETISGEQLNAARAERQKSIVRMNTEDLPGFGDGSERIGSLNVTNQGQIGGYTYGYTYRISSGSYDEDYGSATVAVSQDRKQITVSGSSHSSEDFSNELKEFLSGRGVDLSEWPEELGTEPLVLQMVDSPDAIVNPIPATQEKAERATLNAIGLPQNAGSEVNWGFNGLQIERTRTNDINFEQKLFSIRANGELLGQFFSANATMEVKPEEGEVEISFYNQFGSDTDLPNAEFIEMVAENLENMGLEVPRGLDGRLELTEEHQFNNRNGEPMGYKIILKTPEL